MNEADIYEKSVSSGDEESIKKSRKQSSVSFDGLGGGNITDDKLMLAIQGLSIANNDII